MKVKIKKTAGNDDIPMPRYQTEGSAAVDLHAAVTEPTIIAPGEIKLIPLGFMTEFSHDYVAEITPRSGLAIKHGISLVNSPGILDGDYRGEWKLIMINHGKADFVIRRGERVAQANFKKIERVEFEECIELNNSQRNDGGFGSTGK